MYLASPCDLQIGNRVTVFGVCTQPRFRTNPGGFDAVSYYHAQNVTLLMKKAVVEARKTKLYPLRHLLYRLRVRMSGIITACLDERSAAILRTMLAGDRAGLDDEVRDLYRDGGIVHTLAISGLHISVLGMQFFSLLQLAGLGALGSAGLSGSLLLAYVVMTGASVSSVRALLMFSLYLGAKLCGRTYDLPTAAFAAAAALLYWNRKLITQAGFLLSFAAVGGIAAANMLQDALSKKTRERLPKKRQEKRKRRQALLFAVCPCLATLPLCALFFYQVPVYGVLMNLLVLPLMQLVLTLGIAGTAAGALHLTLGRFVMAPVHYLLTGIVFLCEKLRLLPGAVLVTGRPSWEQIVLYYALAVWMLFFFCKKRKIDLPKAAFGIILLVVFLCYRAPAPWTMTFLDVGQGDGCCLRTESGSVWMVDGGSSSQTGLARYCLEPFLKSRKMTAVDVWIVSHLDEDHVNGLLQILQTYQKNLIGANAAGITVRHIVIPRGAPDCAEKDELQTLAARHGIPVTCAGAGTILRAGGTRAEFLAPREGAAQQNANEGSAVVAICCEGFTALMTGDLEGSGEECLLREERLGNADLLKVAHHGSKNSTSAAFLKRVHPQTAVISCGAGNRYGHPHEETLARLREEGIQILRTDETGAIDVVVKDGAYDIYCAVP